VQTGSAGSEASFGSPTTDDASYVGSSTAGTTSPRNPIGSRASISREERDKRCGWRGSVGVFGEGGFV
jgi:hypothetical protein